MLLYTLFFIKVFFIIDNGVFVDKFCLSFFWLIFNLFALNATYLCSNLIRRSSSFNAGSQGKLYRGLLNETQRFPFFCFVSLIFLYKCARCCVGGSLIRGSENIFFKMVREWRNCNSI